MDNLLADFRRAARVLSTSPGLVLVSVLSLGLGLGANLTLFQLNLRIGGELERVPGLAVGASCNQNGSVLRPEDLDLYGPA